MKPEGLEFATNRVQYPGTRLRRDKGYWIRSLRTRNAPVSQQDERGEYWNNLYRKVTWFCVNDSKSSPHRQGSGGSWGCGETASGWLG